MFPKQTEEKIPEVKEQRKAFEVGLTSPFGQIVPSGRIFIRNFYVSLFRRLIDRFATEKKVTISVTGTPGTGKSLFGLLLLMELVNLLKASSASLGQPMDNFGLGLCGRIVHEHAGHLG